MGKKIAFGVLAGIVLLVVIIGFWVSGTYNSLVRLDQATQAQWAQVQNVYQRRADLVPNLVETVKGAANFERDTLTAVTEARARVGQVTSGAVENIANATDCEGNGGTEVDECPRQDASICVLPDNGVVGSSQIFYGYDDENAEAHQQICESANGTYERT